MARVSGSGSGEEDTSWTSGTGARRFPARAEGRALLDVDLSLELRILCFKPVVPQS